MNFKVNPEFENIIFIKTKMAAPMTETENPNNNNLSTTITDFLKTEVILHIIYSCFASAVCNYSV